MSFAKSHLKIFRKESPVTVLGPGRRAGIWVQGCGFACPGCIVPESWDSRRGFDVSIHELADWVLAQPNIEGITLSGGEPMLQAGLLAELIDTIRANVPLTVMVYTGYTHEALLAGRNRDHLALLDRIDLLVDGLYVESRHADLLWRGSRNQRLIALSPRYADLIDKLDNHTDRSAGMQVFSDPDGAFGYVGVPSRPGFPAAFVAKIAEFGIIMGKPKEAANDGPAASIKKGLES